MKRTYFLLLLIVGFSAFAFNSFDDDKPWTSDDLMSPEKLVQIMKESKSDKPVIFDIGTGGIIEWAIDVGAASTQDNQKRLAEEAKKITKDKEVLIYCGCCKLKECPNVPPAYHILKQAGFKKVWVLNLVDGLEPDWISKGYPMKKK